MTTTTATGNTPAADYPGGTPTQRRRTRRRWPWVVGGAIVLLLLLVLIGRRGGRGGPAVGASDLATVERGAVEKTVESAGRVVSNMDVEIKCRASGEITKLPFDISQHVRKRDLLCQLDPTDERLAVRSAEVGLAQSQAKLEQAKQNLETGRLNLDTTRLKVEATLASAKVRAGNLASKAERQRELVAQQLGSREEYETAQTDAASAKADEMAAQVGVDELKQQAIQLQFKEQDVRSAEAAVQEGQIGLDTAKQNLAYTTVESPIDGTVSKMDVRLGVVVASGTGGFSGGTTIMTVSDLGRMFVMATVDQSDFGGVRVGQTARVAVDARPGRTFEGTVVRLPTTGVSSNNVVTFEVKVEVTDAHKDLLSPEMTGTVTIVEDRRADVLHVPAGAVTRDGGRAYVKTAAGRRTPVTLGLVGSESVEVTGGVEAGERVVLGTEELPTRWKSESR